MRSPMPSGPSSSSVGNGPRPTRDVYALTMPITLSSFRAGTPVPLQMPAGELFERRLLQIRGQFTSSALGGGATERGGARGPGLSALGAEVLVPSDDHDVRREAGLFANGLPDGGENALTHFRVTSHDFEAATF